METILAVNGPDYQGEFTRIASVLINQCRLVAGGQRYRMVELEFYLNTPEHPDLFCHGDPFQDTRALWYFHRAGGKTYIENSFKGVDISIGHGEVDGVTSPGGGILIRSMEDMKGNVTEGPSRCVDLILRDTGYAKVVDLVTELEKTKYSVEHKDSTLYLELCTDLPIVTVYATPRVGLSLKKGSEPRLPYIMAPYRFSGHYHQLSKNNVLIVLSLYYLYKITDPVRLMNLTGTRKHILDKYLQMATVQRNVPWRELNVSCSKVEEMVEIFCWRYWSLIHP